MPKDIEIIISSNFKTNTVKLYTLVFLITDMYPSFAKVFKYLVHNLSSTQVFLSTFFGFLGVKSKISGNHSQILKSKTKMTKFQELVNLAKGHMRAFCTVLADFLKV